MARYMYGETELNHTLLNINDETPDAFSAFSGEHTTQLLAAAASAAEAAYFKKSDIQSAVNTSNNPPSSNAVTNALGNYTPSNNSSPYTRADDANLAVNIENGALIDKVFYCPYTASNIPIVSGARNWRIEFKPRSSILGYYHAIQMAFAMHEGNEICLRYCDYSSGSWTFSAWKRLALASEIATTKVNNATHADSADSCSGNAATATYATSAGSAGSVTNGVYTTGDQTIGGKKTFSETISGNLSGTATYASSAGTAGRSDLTYKLGSSDKSPISVRIVIRNFPTIPDSGTFTAGGISFTVEKGNGYRRMKTTYSLPAFLIVNGTVRICSDRYVVDLLNVSDSDIKLICSSEVYNS